ncbi:MAG: hypothetical protein R3Y54_12310 [Eubacteriales bacterium]
MNFCENETVCLYLKDLVLLEDLVSAKQKIQLFEHHILGYVLVINGEIQHIQNYQCLYHEILVHLPISFIESPKDALVIGGGSLFTAFELLKYPSIETVTLCDYDPMVLALMKKYYQHARDVLNDSRFIYIENDALKYINSCKSKFDIIINDCFNLLEVSNTNKLSMFSKMNNLLSSEGVCSDIIYRHIFDGNITHETICEIKKHSKIVLSLVAVPEYPGVLHINTIWGNNSNLNQFAKETFNLFQKAIFKESNDFFEYYNPKNIPYYLYLPPYIHSKL